MIPHMVLSKILFECSEGPCFLCVVCDSEPIPGKHKLCDLQLGICHQTPGYSCIRSSVKAAVEYVFTPMKQKSIAKAPLVS